MARSTYLDSLNIGDPISNSFTSTSFDNLKTNAIDDSWSNPNAVVADPTYLSGMYTLDKNFLPRFANDFTKGRSNLKAPSSITVPPGYLPATITIYKGSTNVFSEIPIIFPSSFSNSISASYAKESPVGSKQPIVAFDHTDAETFPFSFVASADYLPSNYKSLKDYLEAIKEMVRPNHSGSTVLAPYVVLSFADYQITCVCTSIQITYADSYSYKSFIKADVNCEFMRIE